MRTPRISTLSFLLLKLLLMSQFSRLWCRQVSVSLFIFCGLFNNSVGNSEYRAVVPKLFSSATIEIQNYFAHHTLLSINHHRWRQEGGKL
jgi:hypothetical protein